MLAKHVIIATPEGLFANSSLEVEDGIITKLVLGKRQDDLPQGLVLIPGIVDLHGDMLEREMEPRPGSRFPSTMTLKELDRRHVAAGLTTAYLALSFAEFVEHKNNDLESRTRELVETVTKLETELSCDTRIHARFEVIYPKAAQMLREMVEQGQVKMISVMDHSPGQGQFRDLEGYVSYMANWLKVGRHEAEAELNRQLARPKSWEIVRDLCSIALKHDLPIASHDDDTADKVDLMQGFNTTISEFPVTLEAAAAAKSKGMWTLMGAPNALRGGSHSGNLSAVQALHEGLLDLLASDYYPASMLQATYQLSRLGYLPFYESLKLVSLHPAQAVGLADRGSLELGKRADMVLIDIGERPQVVASFVKGKLVYWNGQFAEVLGIQIKFPQREATVAD